MITVAAFPNIKIKCEIKDNKLNVTLIENDEYYYFPQEQLLLSINLNDQKKRQHNLQAMYTVLNGISVNRLRSMDSILQDLEVNAKIITHSNVDNWLDSAIENFDLIQSWPENINNLKEAKKTLIALKNALKNQYNTLTHDVKMLKLSTMAL